MNINQCVLEKTVENQLLKQVNSFLMLRDNHTILCGCFYGLFCFYDMNTDKCSITKNNQDGNISVLLLINDNTFLSCSEDYNIKVWKYKI